MKYNCSCLPISFEFWYPCNLALFSYWGISEVQKYFWANFQIDKLLLHLSRLYFRKNYMMLKMYYHPLSSAIWTVTSFLQHFESLRGTQFYSQSQQEILLLIRTTKKHLTFSWLLNLIYLKNLTYNGELHMNSVHTDGVWTTWKLFCQPVETASASKYPGCRSLCWAQYLLPLRTLRARWGMCWLGCTYMLGHSVAYLVAPSGLPQSQIRETPNKPLREGTRRNYVLG